MPTKTVKVTTDQDGLFTCNEVFNTPGPFGVTVDLSATLIAPEDVSVSGTLDVDATDGRPQNDAKHFVLTTGERQHLGEWKLDGGDNDIKVSGLTAPCSPNTEIEIEI